MLDVLGVADALKAVAGEVSGVKTALIGVNQAFPSTPAVEVVPTDARLQTLAAGQSAQLQVLRLQVVVYVAASRNLEEDERTLLPIVETFVETVSALAFDETLGGRVEDTRVTSVGFDLVKREARWYRVAVVDVFAGELGDEI